MFPVTAAAFPVSFPVIPGRMQSEEGGTGLPPLAQTSAVPLFGPWFGLPGLHEALFHPLRLALTGREQGPELKSLLPQIGREKAARRLAGEAA